MQDAPGVLVGGVQYTPDDPLPSPIVAVTFSERSRAEEAAKTLMSLQNGVRPFQTGPVIYVGDTNIKVRVSPAGSSWSRSTRTPIQNTLFALSMPPAGLKSHSTRHFETWWPLTGPTRSPWLQETTY